jgi:hypothetical protein
MNRIGTLHARHTHHYRIERRSRWSSSSKTLQSTKAATVANPLATMLADYGSSSEDEDSDAAAVPPTSKVAEGMLLLHNMQDTCS